MEFFDDSLEIVCCQMGCGGKKDLCIELIKDAINRGKVVFMAPYSEHVAEKARALGYTVKKEDINGVPMKMWITRGWKLKLTTVKGGKSD